MESVCTDDIREGLIDLVRSEKYFRLSLRRMLKAFGKTADDFAFNVIKDLQRANTNLPTYLSISYVLPYFPGLQEERDLKVPKKWIDESEVRDVLSRCGKDFVKVVFSVVEEKVREIPAQFKNIVKNIRAAIPAKRLYDIRVLSTTSKTSRLVQGSNMLRAIRICKKTTTVLDLGFAAYLPNEKVLEIRTWNSNMTDNECVAMVKVLQALSSHNRNYSSSSFKHVPCRPVQSENELPLAIDIRGYLKRMFKQYKYDHDELEKELSRMRRVFGDTYDDYVQNILKDLLASKTRIPVLRSIPKIHLDGTYWPGLKSPGPFYSTKEMKWAGTLNTLSDGMKKEGLNLIDAMKRKRNDGNNIDFDDNYQESYGAHGTRKLSGTCLLSLSLSHCICTNFTHNLKGEKGSWKIFTLSSANGEENPDAMRFAPKTLEFLRRVPRKCGSACLSVLRPGAKILLHRGPSNCRVTCHFGIVVPKGNGLFINVGAEKRHWKEGEWLMFDDSYPHEVRNDTNGWRCVLIVDVWNPELSDVECDMLREVVHDATSGGCGCTVV